MVLFCFLRFDVSWRVSCFFSDMSLFWFYAQYAAHFPNQPTHTCIHTQHTLHTTITDLAAELRRAEVAEAPAVGVDGVPPRDVGLVF